MPNPGPENELGRLEAFVRDIEARYLAPHISHASLAPPSTNEQLDVAAFVVLAHGAIENFVEGLAIWIVERVESNWVIDRRVSQSTASLLFRTRYRPKRESDVKAVYDTLRLALKQAKSERTMATNMNHGITPKHIRSLLAPLGVDIPDDSILVASLESLVSIRHEWAHQYRFGARSPKSAQDVKKTADDCLRFATQLSANVVALGL